MKPRESLQLEIRSLDSGVLLCESGRTYSTKEESWAVTESFDNDRAVWHRPLFGEPLLLALPYNPSDADG